MCVCVCVGVRAFVCERRLINISRGPVLSMLYRLHFTFSTYMKCTINPSHHILVEKCFIPQLDYYTPL